MPHRIRFEPAPPAGHIVIDRPERKNALSTVMWEAIPERVAEADAHPDVAVILLRGADRTAFAAGADIAEFPEIKDDPSKIRRFAAAVERAEAAVAAASKPVLAMIDGPCMGGALSLALACDIRFAATSARFAVPPAKLGLVYGYRGTRALVTLAGPAAAKDLLFSGRQFGAEEALRLGLINRLLAPEALEPETLAYTAEIAERAPFSVRAAKAMVARVQDGVAESEAETLDRFVAAFRGEDFAEGLNSFVEKRPPRFRRGG